MSALERFMVGVLLLVTLAAGGWFAVQHYGAAQYEAGRVAAVAAGEHLRQVEADRHRDTESALRAQLAQQDADAYRKEKEYATTLEAAQRRVRAGVDSLRCPAASTVQPSAAPGPGSATAGPQPDHQRADLVPEVAADLLGIAADAAGLVRKYERLEQRFEACRAVNAQ